MLQHDVIKQMFRSRSRWPFPKSLPKPFPEPFPELFFKFSPNCSPNFSPNISLNFWFQWYLQESGHCTPQDKTSHHFSISPSTIRTNRPEWRPEVEHGLIDEPDCTRSHRSITRQKQHHSGQFNMNGVIIANTKSC